MARPIKRNAEYFPHLPSGKAMKYLRKKYGNDGYATWYILLEQLAQTDDHHILCDEFQLTLLADECGVSCEVLTLIIDDLAQLNKFHAQLWKECKVLYSENLRNSVEDAYRMRRNKCIETNDILVKFGLNAQETKLTAQETTKKGGYNTQSKVKQSKEERDKKEKPLSLPLKTYKPAAEALRDVVANGAVQSIAKTSHELFQLIDTKAREEPEWWKKIADFAEIGILNKEQKQHSIKQWANHVIKDKPKDLWSWDKAEASLQSWLMWERKNTQENKNRYGN